MSILIGQVSYLPNNELRTKRLEAARFQIEWLNKLLPQVKIVSVAQAYNASDYVDGVFYHEYENGIGAGPARNVILKEFYNSDYDWLFLCDDDTVLYPHYSADEFIKDIAFNVEKFDKIIQKGIDIISETMKDSLNIERYSPKRIVLNG